MKWTIHTSSTFLSNVGPCCCHGCCGCRCLGLLTSRRVLDMDQQGSMCKQACAHTLYPPFSIPKKWQGIQKKEKEAASIGGKAPLSEEHWSPPAAHVQQAHRPSVISLHYHTDRLEWRGMRAFQALSGTQPPAGREQPMRTRPCPDACPASPSVASWFQV